MKSRWTTVLAGVVLAGCALETDTHNEGFGPKVTNKCPQSVIAGIGESLADAESDIRESPITMPTGRRSTIAYVVQNDYVPANLFLLVGVSADTATLLELETGLSETLCNRS